MLKTVLKTGIATCRDSCYTPAGEPGRRLLVGERVRVTVGVRAVPAVDGSYVRSMPCQSPRLEWATGRPASLPAHEHAVRAGPKCHALARHLAPVGGDLSIARARVPVLELACLDHLPGASPLPSASGRLGKSSTRLRSRARTNPGQEPPAQSAVRRSTSGPPSARTPPSKVTTRTPCRRAMVRRCASPT